MPALVYITPAVIGLGSAVTAVVCVLAGGRANDATRAAMMAEEREAHRQAYERQAA